MLTKIELGKTYRTRGGEEVIVLRIRDDNFSLMLEATGTALFRMNMTSGFKDMNEVWRDGKFIGRSSGALLNNDIVEEVSAYQQKQLDLF